MVKKISRRLLLCVSIIGMAASCSHPLEIYGEGDITSASGNRDCSLEEFQASDPNCTGNFVVGAYSETYTATPRPGWVFQGWRTYCEHNSLTTQCSFSQPAAMVRSYWFRPVPPLRAAFLETCPNPPNCFEILAPQLGAVTDTSIRIWQAIKGVATFEVRYRTGTDPFTSASVVIDGTTGFVGTVELTGLSANTTYDYETWLNGTQYETSTFSTLPASGWTGQIRFGFATDYFHIFSPFLTLQQAAAKNFDFMLLIGDLIYEAQDPLIDNTVAAYTDRYWLTWNESNFTELGKTTPLFMMWDDHEIVDDYYPGHIDPRDVADRYPAARSAYDLYQDPHNPTSGGLLYYSFSAPGGDFFVLDTRSHRDPNLDIDDANKSMLGDVQRNAMLDYLENSTAPFKFIITSVPFHLAETGTDRWYSYQTERALILSELEMRGISGVVFISGDSHWSGAFRMTSAGGYVYYDFVPSPGGTFIRKLPTMNNNPGETQIYASDLYKTFGDFEIDLSGPTPMLRAAYVDEDGVDRCVITIGSDETGVISPGPAATCL
jgi:alkaline phosphatase D